MSKLSMLVPPARVKTLYARASGRLLQITSRAFLQIMLGQSGNHLALHLRIYTKLGQSGNNLTLHLRWPVGCLPTPAMAADWGFLLHRRMW